MKNWKERFVRFMASEEVTNFIQSFSLAASIAVLLH